MLRFFASAGQGGLFRRRSVQQQELKEQELQQQHDEEAPQPQQVEEEQECCPICFETLAKAPPIGGLLVNSSSSALQGSAEKTKISCDCGHHFCQECLSLYVATSIHEGKTSKRTLRCPIDKCAVPFDERLIQSLASPGDWEKHLRFVHACTVNEDPLLRWCPKPGCDGLAHLSHSPTTAEEAREYLPVMCDAQRCGHTFCANCGCAPHLDASCDVADDRDYFAWKKEKGADNIKPCPQCYLDTEKMSGGCPAMLCTRCRAVWCWNCHKKVPSNLIGPGRCNCKRYALAHADPLPLRIDCVFLFFNLLEWSCYIFVIYQLIMTLVCEM